MLKNSDHLWNKVISVVKKYGWCNQIVLGSEKSPPFAYTIGMSDKRLPELFISGLRQDISHVFLNLVCKGLLDGSFQGQDAEILNEVATVPLMFRELDLLDVEKVMLGAIRYANGSNNPIKFMQILFPDVNGNFPGNPNCDSQCSKAQSLSNLK